MKLYMSEGSPFARKVRVVLLEKGLAFESDVLNGLRPVDGTIGPTLSVPLLEDGARRIWESDLIIDYLLHTYPDAKAGGDMAATPPLSPWMARPERRWDDMTTLATIASLAGSIANLRLMQPDGLTPENSDYLARQRTRVGRCLYWLEERVTDEGFAPGWFSIMDISFVCPIAFCEIREVTPWRGRPKLEALFDRSRSRPSLLATPLSPMPLPARYRIERTPIA